MVSVLSVLFLFLSFLGSPSQIETALAPAPACVLSGLPLSAPRVLPPAFDLLSQPEQVRERKKSVPAGQAGCPCPPCLGVFPLHSPRRPDSASLTAAAGWESSGEALQVKAEAEGGMWANREGRKRPEAARTSQKQSVSFESSRLF